MRTVSWITSSALCALVAATSARADVDINSCGQEIPAGQVGTLRVDLDCPVETNPVNNAIRMGSRSTLLLNGHSVRGAAETITAYLANGTVRIIGPGQIVDAGLDNPFVGVAVNVGHGRLDLRDVVITNAKIAVFLFNSSANVSDTTIDGGRQGIIYRAETGSEKGGRLRASNLAIGPGDGASPGIDVLQLNAQNVSVTGRSDGIVVSRLKGEDVTSSQNAGDGIRADLIKADRVTASDNSNDGIHAARLVGDDVTASGNGDEGIVATKLKGSRYTASQNFSIGIAGGDVRLSDVIADENGQGVTGSGITAQNAQLEGVHATGNSGAGVEASLKLSIENSTLTGNASGGLGIDLVSGTFPSLLATTCGRSSSSLFALNSWGVCGGD